MDGLELLAVFSIVPATLAYWTYSRWRARIVFRKLSGKGTKGRKKALKRLSKEERLIYDRHGLRMLKMFAVAFSVGSCGSLAQGKIHVEADLMVLQWTGNVTMSAHPVAFWILWFILLIIPVALWVLYFHERRALDRRAIKAAMSSNAGSSESPSIS